MYFDNNTISYKNGKWLKAQEATTSLYDQTLHYGNGVFEGIRAYKTEFGVEIFKAREHYERLKYSAEKMHISFDYTVDQLINISYELLEKNGLTDAYIRPLVYLGANMSLRPVKDVNLFMCAWPWDKLLGGEQIKVMTSSYCRPNPKSAHIEAKTVGHYTNSILSTTEALQKGFNEALLLDQNGFVAEGPGANFFFEKDGELHTAPLGNILSGITRKTIIELAKELGVVVHERLFSIEEVKSGSAAFFTGTAVEVVGIESLDDYTFPVQWEDTLGSQLERMYINLVKGRKVQKFELV